MKSMPFTIAVCVGSPKFVAQQNFQQRRVSEDWVHKVLILKSSNAGLDVWDVLRMSPERLSKVALRWTPAGKRRKPKTTWRKTVEIELIEMGLSMGRGTGSYEDSVEKRHCCRPMPHPTGGNKV